MKKLLDLPPKFSAGGQEPRGDVGHPWLHLPSPWLRGNLALQGSLTQTLRVGAVCPGGYAQHPSSLTIL